MEQFIPAAVTLLIAACGGAVGYGVLRGQVRAQEQTIARLEEEITRLHGRSNHNKAELAAAQLQIAKDIAAIKACIGRLETKLDNHVHMHEQGYFNCGRRKDD